MNHKKNINKLIFVLIFFIFITTAILAASTAIVGAGATFPYPVYSKWADIYFKKTGTKLNYQAIGSGGGIKQIKAKTVDFGASDKPLTTIELEKSGLVQFPMIISGIIPIINLPGIKSGELKLTAMLLADIYLGKIKKWNDPKIKEINPRVNLPDRYITVVYRSDGSGTTYLFTSYLAKISKEWQKTVGSDTAVNWPVGIGGKGNEGVAAFVQRIKGTIGYVEFAYGQQNQMSYVALQNKSGNFVKPSLASFQVAIKNIDYKAPTNLTDTLMNDSGGESWPIIGASYILMKAIQKEPQQGIAVLNFFDWAFHEGKDAALQLQYIPIPADLVNSIETLWKTKIKDKNGQAIWKNGNQL